jgi:alpha-glucoside transport system substrate-binding protein
MKAIRKYPIAAILVFASLVLSACGTATTPAPANTAVPPTPTAKSMPATEAAPAPTATEAPPAIDCAGVKSGDTIVMVYQWSGNEESMLNTILKPWVDACGVSITPTSTRDSAVLDSMVKGGNAPDVVFWPNLIAEYKDQLVPIDTLGANAVDYVTGSTDQGMLGGKWLAMPVKSDIKSIIWYSPPTFTAKGYAVPATWDELNALVEKMVADGNVPWSMGEESGSATGWTGSDFIQDILLVQQGPQFVNDIISGKVSYDDAGVKAAYEVYGKWASDPKYTPGGAAGTLSTNFNDAILKVFSTPPEAYMVKQSGFASGTITSTYTDDKYGVDFDFFVIPGIQGLQGGSDWLMAFNSKPVVKSLVMYLSSPLGGVNWAKASFNLTPNKAGAGNYTDPGLIKEAAVFYTSKGLTPDIGDTLGDGFQTAEWKAIVDYVNGANLDTVLAAAAAAQQSTLAAMQ